MIGFDHLRFFHAPKTGGTWVEHLAEHCGVVRVRGGQHDPAFLDTFEGRRVGTTRDPWTGYRSLYAHALRSGQVQESFKDVLRRWTRKAPILDGHVGTIWSPTEKGSRAFLALHHIGLWTWSQLWHYGTRRAWEFGVFEWAVDSLLQQARLQDAVRSIGLDGQDFPPVNTSDNLHDLQYDTEMLSWVEAADGDLARLLGQTFGACEDAVVHLTPSVPPLLPIVEPPKKAPPVYRRGLPPPKAGDSISVFGRVSCAWAGVAAWPFSQPQLTWECMGGIVEGRFALDQVSMVCGPRTMVILPDVETGVSGFVAGVYMPDQLRPDDAVPLRYDRQRHTFVMRVGAGEVDVQKVSRVWFDAEGAWVQEG